MTNKLKESEIHRTARTQSFVKQLFIREGRVPILRYLGMDGVDTDYKAFWRVHDE